MLRQTFIHLPGVGCSLERRLWAEGILTWDDFVQAEVTPGISAKRRAGLVELIEEGRTELDNISFWRDRLPASEHWRLYRRFRDMAASLDIETTGRAVDQGGEVSVIGFFDGRRYLPFVNGYNLDRFELALERAGLLLTFNGASFDLPYLAAYIRHLRLPPIHIDVCHAVHRLGFKGGLKKLEPLFGLVREESIGGIDGFQAINLWQRYLEGDRQALGRLIRYNRADTVNLMPIMDKVYFRLRMELLGPAGVRDND